ncbi:acyl-CoA dehydrogenase [Denitratisoma sp. agr-D3]
MSQYQAPITDIRFVMETLTDFSSISQLPGFEEATSDVAEAIVEEGGRFAAEVVAPLNRIGDTTGCQLDADGCVTTPPGWQNAYRHFCEGGWNGIGSPTDFGGQGLPSVLSLAVKELVTSANLSFSLGPLLTAGAVEAISRCASDELKAIYLPKLVSGEWTGTMNLTEPQAGSDLALLRSKAEPSDDGSYRIFGQKIFITYGEHDLAENIIHLVLARLPDAPPGIKGISLFVVPKFLVNADGSLGMRNDVQCVSLEHKLGIHASPTCVMTYGEKGGAVGYLVGKPHRGLEYMFIMMNEARLGVGLQGVAIGERAYQQALSYARERIQGRDVVTGKDGVAIVHHPEIKRTLLSMRSRVEAARALAYLTASWLDRAHAHPEQEERQRYLFQAEYLIPIVKGWATETGVDVASLGVQVHGGMGYIEETGAAQHLRDARITTIYEGTTGIQANDLVFRKLLRDEGATARLIFAQIQQTISQCRESGDATIKGIGLKLAVAAEALSRATLWVAGQLRTNAGAVAASAVPYLYLSGTVFGGWQMASAALAAESVQAKGEGTFSPVFLKEKIAVATFFAHHVLPQANAYAEEITHGAPSVCDLETSFWLG